MRINTLVCAVIASLMLVAGVSPSVEAAVVSRVFWVGAGGFGPGAPVAATTGQFHVTWDNSGDVAQTALSITGSMSGLIADMTLVYAYTAESDTLVIGGSLNDVTTVQMGTDDYRLSFTGASTTPGDLLFFYATAGGDLVVAATLSVTAEASGIPEPASLVLLASAMTAAGWAVRRRIPHRQVRSGGEADCLTRA